jgi:hypothetical protein
MLMIASPACCFLAAISRLLADRPNRVARGSVGDARDAYAKGRGFSIAMKRREARHAIRSS